MPDPLSVIGEDPVELGGTLDTATQLQLLHGTVSLADHNQTIHAEHDDLASPTGIVRITLADFSGGGHNWQITAVHDPGAGSVTWARGTDHAYYDFGPLTSEQEVEVTATSDASPPATKGRTVRIKTSPIDAQPDRPRR